jgi:hypothetical protein
MMGNYSRLCWTLPLTYSKFAKLDTILSSDPWLSLYLVGVKLNGTHQLPVYADDVNLFGGNIGTIKKITKTITDTSKEAGLKSKHKEN